MVTKQSNSHLNYYLFSDMKTQGLPPENKPIDTVKKSVHTFYKITCHNPGAPLSDKSEPLQNLLIQPKPRKKILNRFFRNPIPGISGIGK